jgi:3-phosphoshikimate 1-carboxyvinyltransferase
LRPGRGARDRRVRCGASGTTYRFLAAVSALSPRPTRFYGTPRLGLRPIFPLLRALRQHGADVRPGSTSGFPVRIVGPLRSGEFRITGSESSQFVSALLFVLPRLSGRSTLDVEGPLVSVPYVRATLAVLRAHGVRVTGPMGHWAVEGNQAFDAEGFDVPGDASSAAYLWAAGAISGGSVTVTGVSARWPQADRAILDLLGSAGVSVRARGSAVCVSGRPTEPFDVELTPSPDLFPLAGAVAALIPGESILRGAPQISGKESDRRAATIELVRRLGGRARSGTDGLHIQGTRRPAAVAGARWTDHRLVMSAAVASLGAGGRLAHAETVTKSFPGFWSTLARLGVRLRVTP